MKDICVFTYKDELHVYAFNNQTTNIHASYLTT